MKKRVFRWCVRVAVLLGVIAAAAVVFVVWVVGEFGESGTERWLGERLRGLVNERLNATFDFDTLDYRYPDTVELTGLRLHVESPDAFDLVRCERVTLALAERPRRDRPIRVREAVLVKPELNLLESDGGALVGFSGLIRSTDANVAEAQQTPKTFGEQFALEAVSLLDARVTHRVSVDRPALVLDGIAARTTLDRTDADAMAVQLVIDRPGTLHAEAQGALRTDTGELRDARLDVVLDLSGAGLETLPTELQELAARYAVSGRLKVKAQGGLSFRDFMGSELSLVCTLRDAGFSWAGLRYPVSSLTVAAEAKDGTLTFTQAEGELMGGWASLNGSVSMERPWSAKGALSLDEVRLEAREAEPVESTEGATGSSGAAPLLTGAVTGRVTWDGPLGDASAVTGGGNFRVEAARLSRLPVVSGLLDALSIVPGLAGPRDRAEVVFQIADGRLLIDNSFLSVDAAGIKATGSVGFDGSLDLVARAGPLERIEKQLGKLGDVLSATLSFLPRYRVTGTVSQPAVGVAMPNAKAGGQ